MDLNARFRVVIRFWRDQAGPENKLQLSAVKAAAETGKPRQILSSLYGYMFLRCEYAIALGVLEHILVRD